MTIDTEGSELALVEDFPWDEFDIRVVQIEQLVEQRYKAQAGRKDKIIQHLEKHGYKLLSLYTVELNDTDDIIMTRNIDEFLTQTRKHPRDGDPNKKHMPLPASLRQEDGTGKDRMENLEDRPALDPHEVMHRRRYDAVEQLRARRKAASA